MDCILQPKKLNGAEKKNLYGIAMRGRRGHHIVYAWLQFLYNFGEKSSMKITMSC